MRIAIVGSGGAGLSALWALHEHSAHHVEIFEKDSVLGGHAHTIQVQRPGKGPCAIDTAFVMMSAVGHANLFKFIKHKRIPAIKTDTSFSVTSGCGSWGSKSLGSLFSAPGSWYSPRIYRMIFVIFRFHHASLAVLSHPEVYQNVSIGQYLDEHSYGRGFKDDYLIPLAATYWSLPPTRVLEQCPIWVLVRCFHHFGLLQMWNRPEWYAFAGGSRTYVDAIRDDIPKENIHLDSAIEGVVKTHNGVIIRDEDGRERKFDHVIMATHTGTTLKLLSAGASLSFDDERALKEACECSDFEITMHWDDRLMPDNDQVCGTWNTTTPAAGNSSAIDSCRQNMEVTFDMNSLHNLPTAVHGRLYGTVNPSKEIDESKVFDRLHFSTPVFTPALLSAQRRLDASDSHRGPISIVGAWRRLGSHEDAWIMGLQAAQRLGAELPFRVDDAMRPVEESALADATGFALESMEIIRQLVILVYSAIFALTNWIWACLLSYNVSPTLTLASGSFTGRELVTIDVTYNSALRKHRARDRSTGDDGESDSEVSDVGTPVSVHSIQQSL